MLLRTSSTLHIYYGCIHTIDYKSHILQVKCYSLYLSHVNNIVYKHIIHFTRGHNTEVTGRQIIQGKTQKFEHDQKELAENKRILP